VAVSFLTVLIATSAALSYTRYSILSDEKKHLLETARALAREYSDKADFAHRINEVPLSKIPSVESSNGVLSPQQGCAAECRGKSKAGSNARTTTRLGYSFSDP